MNKIRVALLLSILVVFSVFAQTPAENVVATVNGEDITIEDLTSGQVSEKGFSDAFMDQNSRSRRHKANADQADWLLEEAINRSLMLTEAKKVGMAEDSDVAEAVAAFKKAVMVDMYVNKVLILEAKPTEEEILAEYEQTSRYNQQAHAEVIRRWVQSEEEAQAIIAEIGKVDIQNPDGGYNIDHFYYQEYEKEARQRDGVRSADSDTKNGSSRGGNESDQKMELMELVKVAKTGDIIGPVQQGQSWVVVRVVRQVPEGKRSFEEVSDEIEGYLTQQNLRELQQKKQEELRKSATVTVYNENLNKAFSE